MKECNSTVPKRGLVLDGGGVFGIGQAHILSQVDVSKFDFFVGTSIGSVNAAACASGMDLKNLPKFFHEEMPLIFKTHPCYKYNLFNPEYPDKELNRALLSLMPDIKFKDVKKPLFIPAAKLSRNRLKVFSSLDEQDGEWDLWEICRSATAAETYFKPWEGYADGAVFANNPSMVAIACACKILQYDIHNIELFSIGTGSYSSSDGSRGKPTKNYSIFTWGAWLLKTLLRGSSNSMHEYFATSLPIAKYKRIQFSREDDWKIDSVKDMLAAEKKWGKGIRKGIRHLKNF